MTVICPAVLVFTALLLNPESAAQAAPAPTTATAVPADPAPPASYVPERVFQSDKKRFADFELMLVDLMYADVVFVGEQHDDPNTHRLELAVLEGLARRRGSIILSLEMFERDVQAVLDAYLTGTITEDEFLTQSRPWPRYRTDYRPLVELARARGWVVVASNVPRKLANEVSKAGLEFLKSMPDGDRGYVAKDLQCPFDDYFDRFAKSMNAHPMPGDEKKTVAEKRQTTERFYFAQCVKDETMAESIVAAHQRVASSRPIVVHFNGSFHSDYGLGTAARVDRRLKGATVKVVTMAPVENLDQVKPSKDDRKRADYLVYTLKASKPAAPAPR